jgi:hypothetical protein
MKKLASCVLILGTTLLNGCVTDGGASYAEAVAYQPGRGLGLIPGYTSKKIADNKWQVSMSGNNYNPPSQVVLMTQVRAAQLAVENGYSHFRFLSTPKVSCQSYNYTQINNAFVQGEMEGAPGAQPGFVDAQAFLNEHLAEAQRKPTTAEKAAAYNEINNNCENARS